MNNYTKLQKFISFLLIFSILFSFTINISFFSFVGKIFASDTTKYNVVSIFVQEDIYPRIRNEVYRYAEDIQSVLENTKTIIIPTPSDEHPFNIASVNEKLYFEGYKGLNGLSGESSLIGSVFIGDLPLPVVENNGSFQKTVLPYVDFKDKLYIYNNKTKRYELNKDFSTDPQTEVWHGFISPNTGDKNEDVQEIKDYFDKNHDYYTGAGNFDSSKGVTNGKSSEDSTSNYKPHVFYYDQIRESKSVSYVDYKAYEQYLNNREDINYNRFSKELANKLSSSYIASQSGYIGDLSSVFGTGVDLGEYGNATIPTTNVPDIQTRYLVKNSVKRLIEIFNGSTLGEMRKDVHNAGRYNSGSNSVGVDLIPYIASNLDTLSEAVVRNVNNQLEDRIDTIVKNGLSRDIAIPTTFTKSPGDIYKNYLYGTDASTITDASSCSIYRGSLINSGTLVEAHRGFDTTVSASDTALCNTAQTLGYWGGYSPLNLDTSGIGNGTIWKLKFKDPTNATKPLFDIKGSYKSEDATKVQSPLNCYDNNLILTQKTINSGENSTVTQPVNCYSQNEKLEYDHDFAYTFKNFPLGASSCESAYLTLSGETLKSYRNNDCVTGTGPSSGEEDSTSTRTSSEDSVDNTISTTYNYKKINSYIFHKSPTTPEIKDQVKYMATPNLPVDKDRYVDFIAANDTYAKINYPYLFRIGAGAKSFEETKTILKNYLDSKSSEINALINSKNPSSLTEEDKAIYDMLKTGDYPIANVDLYKFLQEKPTKQLVVDGDTKDINYLDTLAFSIYWNNMNSVSAKYKFIFENYLSDQFGGNDANYFLPKNKKQYEISYLGAPGDSKNMYVKLDPEENGDNPYADIMGANQGLVNTLLFSNTSTNDSSMFKCAPPEGVPIWKWIPAVMCRLKTILPPTISISDGKCGFSLLGDGETGDYDTYYPADDSDKNGINDYLEDEIRAGRLDLKSDNKKYYYNSSGVIKAKVLNSLGNVITYDDSSSIKFELVKVEVPADKTTPKKVVYDKYGLSGRVINSSGALNEAKNYINFTNYSVRVTNGIATYNFSTRSKDADVTLKATLELKDIFGNTVVKKEDLNDILIRGNLFYSTSYKLGEYLGSPTLDVGTSNVSVSGVDNIFLVTEEAFRNVKDNTNTLNSYSSAPEKLFISLSNKDKAGKDYDISYPVKVNIKDREGKDVLNKTFSNLSQVTSLGGFKKSGTYTFTMTDNLDNEIIKEIELLPGNPKAFVTKLGSNLIEKGGTTTTNFFYINDEFGNPTSGKVYKIEANISGNSLTFEDGKTTKEFTTYEGYELFNLKSTGNSGKSTINFKVTYEGQSILMTAKSVDVVDKIDFDVTGLPNDIKVGEKKYDFQIKLKNLDATADFNSRAYLLSNSIYIKTPDSFISIDHNSGTGSFETTKKAGEKVNLEFKIEGVKDSFYKEINILPDVPLRLDLSLSNSKIEASTGSLAQLYVELKDRYDNIVWNDSSTQLSLTIPQKYSHIISSSNLQKTVSKGKAAFIINASDTPGVAYFKVASSPSLSNNQVEFEGQSPFIKSTLDSISGMRNSDGALTQLGKKFFSEYDLENYRFNYSSLEALEGSEDFQILSQAMKDSLKNLFNSHNRLIVKGVGENAGRIDTYYFWNKDKITNNKYNGVYTTLLGASYGDITVKDNLANSIIFDKNNRGLAVTSLLNDVVKYNDILNVNPNGNISLNKSSQDLSNDISTNFDIDKNGNLEINFLNNTFSKLISRVFYSFKKDNLNLLSCREADLNSCYSSGKDSILIKPIINGYNTSLSGGILSLNDGNSSSLFSVDSDGKITKSPYVNLELNSSYTDSLVLNIKIESKIVGVVGFKLNDSDLTITRDLSNLDSLRSSASKSLIVVYVEGRDYFYRSNYLGNSTNGEIGYTIYYKDPFGSTSNSLDKFSTNFEFGYEGFYDNSGIGWSGQNKALLSFSAGKNVGDATKDYMTFSLINIGDPVISLKPIKKKLPGTSYDRSFDTTIGKLVSKDANNLSYSVFDYNKDGNKDIVILKRNGYIQLLEGTTQIDNFTDKGNLAYITDYSTKGIIETGDFTGDGYDDIFIIDKNSKPVLLNNYQKDFYRIDLEKEFGLSGRVMQAISYDMDKDGISDLVIYDDSGTITIFYGSKTDGKAPKFTKKVIDNSLGLRLNTDVRNDGGLVYFNGLYQIPDDLDTGYIEDSDTLQSIINHNASNLQNNTLTASDDFNESIADALIFTKLSYTPFSESSETDDREKLLSVLPKTLSGTDADIDDVNSGISDASTIIGEMVSSGGFLDTYNKGNNYYSGVNSNDVTTFIRSDYAESQGLKIEKRYLDINGGTLKSDDKIQLKITVQNTTNSYIDDIALVEQIPDPFSFDVENASSLEIDGRYLSGSSILYKEAPDSGYSFLLDSYSYNKETYNLGLYPGQSLILTLSLDTTPFDYGYIEAGLFEEGEAGDDIYGDVIFKLNKKICGETSGIYRSTGVREYEKGAKEALCEKNDKLNDLEKNVTDVDGNKIPDYLDHLIDSGNSAGEDFINYSNDSLNTLFQDSDNDGVPDSEDFSPGFSSDDDFMSGLDSINEKVDAIIEGVDNILDGLSCGFGGGGCIASPLNWAPLAPGSDPTLFGFPIGDGLKVGEGLPIFAFPTVGLPPFTWPPYPIGAGGRLDGSPTGLGISEFRIFVTPTITGAIGTAICFGPNVGVGWLPPPGLSPFVPGGNCIVAAMPLLGCNDDGSDGEIYNVGTSSSNIYNGNCSTSTKNSSKATYFENDLVKDYVNYRKTGTKSTSLSDRMKSTLTQVARGQPSTFLPNGPILKAFDGADSMGEISVDVDTQALKDFRFQDAIKLKMTRIMAFPDFLMDWVTRQIEEIISKLLDFPTLYVILPVIDFDGILNSVGNFIPNLKNAYSKGSQKGEQKEASLSSRIDALNQDKSALNCEEDSIECGLIDVQTARLELERDSGLHQKASGIKAVYKFLSNLPLIAINPEKINVNIPNIDERTINKAISDFQLTKKQWLEEIERARASWTLGYTCSGDSESVAECQRQNEIGSKIILDAHNLVNSIDKNIEILNDYKNLPEKLNKLIRFKEIRLEQILCNIDNITYIMGGRIGENGKRFKAWVELYVLIKAILKSWQLLIDVFVDYSTGCHQCKNERYDLMYFIWKLISMIIPKIPVIQFPKWPDIYIDLHNIRVGLNIGIPEFEFNLRPILLPTLPNLYLPRLPTVAIKLPSLPLLPLIEIPDLPLLPSIPEVKLPDLPPPPKLPKLLSALAAILKILKLITKIMCILKKSPFVPEWRAGDLIAFITERQGFLPFDFLDISMPQFSLPFVDAIKVTTYVNLEFEADFLTEAARQSVMPLNVFTNDIVNLLNIDIGDLDFRNLTPSQIDVKVGTNGVNVESDGKIIDTDVLKDNIDNIKGGVQDLRDNIDNTINGTSFKLDKNSKISLFDFALILSTKFGQVYSYMQKESKYDVTNDEFKKLIAKEISDPTFYENETTSKVAGLWSNTLKYSYAKEDEMINELLENNKNKFDTLRNIINEEIKKTKELKANLNKALEPKDYVTIDSKFSSNVADYNKELVPYNLKTLQSVLDIGKEDTEVSEIKSMGKDVQNRVNNGLQSFSNDLAKSDEYLRNTFNSAKSLAANTALQNYTSSSTSKTVGPLAYQDTSGGLGNTSVNTDNSTSCKIGGSYSYVYKGLYYVEKYLGRKISYRLFDYLDEVDGNELYFERDFDNDGDDEAIYKVGDEIYIKESLKNKKQKTYYSGSPIVLSKSNNTYYDTSKDYYESINNFREGVSDNNYINLSFLQPTNDLLSNFRIEFYQIVDKFAGLENDNYIPFGVKNHIIDAFRDIDDMSLVEDNSRYSLRKNLAYIKNVGNLSNVTLYTKTLKDLQDDVKNKNEVIVNAGTKIYTSSSNVNLVYYSYSDKDKDLKYKSITISPYSNVEFKQDIVISSLNNSLYVEGSSFESVTGNDIIKYVKKPLLPGAKISYDSAASGTSDSYLGISYYDGTEADLDFKYTKYYELYDLGNYSENYLVRTQMENDFYYAKMRSFKNGVFSTYTHQILLSPQLASDNKAPDINGFSNIKVPVYQKIKLDMTDKISDNGGLKNISDIYVDFDLGKDTILDGNNTNDKDYYLGNSNTNFDISIKNNRIYFDIGTFTTLMNKKIRLYVVDGNGNTAYKDVDFIVYSPTPGIKNVDENGIIAGNIDETLQNEPVSLYRYRAGNLTRLKDTSDRKTSFTDSSGKFNFNASKTATGLELNTTGTASTLMAKINEQTGKIDIGLNTNLNIRVYPSNHPNNDLAYPKIILSNLLENVYYEYFAIPNAGEVNVVDDFANIKNVGIYFKMTDNSSYDYFKIPNGVDMDSGQVFIYSKGDPKNSPLVSIFKDGRISTYNGFALEYTTFGDYVVYKILDGNGKEIARVMLIPEANYVMK